MQSPTQQVPPPPATKRPTGRDIPAGDDALPPWPWPNREPVQSPAGDDALPPWSSFGKRDIDLLTAHESFRATPYTDAKNKVAIGHGRNLTDNPLTPSERIHLGLGPDEPVKKVTPQQAAYLLGNDIRTATRNVRETIGEQFDKLDDARRSVLVNMAYNLGGEGFRGFQNMIAAVKAGDYARAADEMQWTDATKTKLTDWYNQVGLRAPVLQEMMRTGQYPADAHRFSPSPASSSQMPSGASSQGAGTAPLSAIPDILQESLPKETQDEIKAAAKTPPTEQEIGAFFKHFPASAAALYHPSNPFASAAREPYSFQILQNSASILGDEKFAEIMQRIQQIMQV